MMDTTLTDSLVGRVLDGRYAVESRIARGGMASVYLARDTRLDRAVAVKVMHPQFADDSEFVARFIREAHAAARLAHPNVVAVFDQGYDGDVVFLVMEYIEGRTLRDLLREHGRLSPQQALSLMQPVLAALGAAHHAGLVHRDVKPENVLLADDGRVKVADFGLARAVSGSNLTGTHGVLIGTVNYLAPEQVERGVADARSDVYAAGVMLYELLVGSPPYRAETPLAVAYRHVHDQVPAPSSAIAGLPAEVDALVSSATARDPDERPRDAEAFLRQLMHAAGAVPQLTAATELFPLDSPTEVVNGTRPLPLTPPRTPNSVDGDAPPRRRRRRRWPYLLVVLLLLTGGAGVAGWWFASGRYVSAPSLIGMSRAAAMQAARHDGFHLRFADRVYSDTIRADDIATQSPRARSDVQRGSTIVVHLSRGIQKFTVPSVRGLTVQGATQLLQAKTFTVKPDLAHVYSSVHSGLVVGTRPGPNESLPHGSAVTLVISKGARPLPLPDVRRDSLNRATDVLTNAGFIIGHTSEDYSDTVPAGSVISQSPVGGPDATAPKGTHISLVVSKGPQLFAVPDVTHTPVGEAVQTLRADGFTPRVHEFPGGPGTVLSQRPGAGTKVRHGTVIDLYVF